jgi:hypothetical protein
VMMGAINEVVEPVDYLPEPPNVGNEPREDAAYRFLLGSATKSVVANTNAAATHEAYLRAIRSVLAARLNEDERIKVLGTELLYGAGRPSVYGICFYNRWKREQTHDVIEISAFNEESPAQLWETVAHELAHVVAGCGVGHGPAWKAAAKRLGLRRPVASGPACIEDLDPQVMEVLGTIPVPQDGNPVTRSESVVRTVNTAGTACPLGIGTQGGTSRGPGSGSRLRLYMCECERSVKVRVASDEFRARCLVCGSAFQRANAQSRRPTRWPRRT